MSRVAKALVDLPQGVTATVTAEAVTIKGAKGSLNLSLQSGIVGENRGSVLVVCLVTNRTPDRPG